MRYDSLNLGSVRSEFPNFYGKLKEPLIVTSAAHLQGETNKRDMDPLKTTVIFCPTSWSRTILCSSEFGLVLQPLSCVYLTVSLS